MVIQQTPLFKRNYKKLLSAQRKVVNAEIKKIIADPTLGVPKKQDLAGIYVHKFKIATQLFLLAYTFDPITLTLQMLGVYENFYRDLKKHIGG